MKLLHVIALTLCLHAPLTHTNTQHDQCSLPAYFGCTILMGAGALCATGAYVAHKAIKQDLCATRKRHDTTHTELKTFKYLLAASATTLATCSIYCFNACINK
jgi:hypothetical protein